MAKNKNLSKAKSNKNDEFYTQLSDIERELRYYRPYFKDKVVLCNCDDPFESNFFMYFVLNFNTLGLKKLICTCYAGSPVAGTKLQYHVEDNGQMSFVYDETGQLTGSEKHAYKAVINVLHDATGNGGIEMVDVAELFKTGENELTELEGDGDFRSPECIDLLKEADIVCTNPPFSLFREYITLLMEYDKQFIIIGNKNAITYKEVFPLLKDNKIWLGYNTIKEFKQPNGDPKNMSGLTRWFTNLDIKKYHEYMICFRNYDPQKYPKFDNYDVINVNKTSDIPCDYTGVMGVPITFLDGYCPEQFEIIEGSNRYGILNTFGMNDKIKENHSHGNNINGKATYFRIFIRYTDSWIASHPDNFKDAS